MSKQAPEGHAIHQPGRRLMQSISLNFVRKKAAGHGRRSVAEALNLTAFIDFLLVTVIFLLMSFSAKGEIANDPSIVLPEASNGAEMMDAPLVSVDGNQVRVNGFPAGTTRFLEDQAGIARIDELSRMLVQIRETWRTTHPGGEPFPGVCILQVDEDVSSRVVKSVFQTAAYAGYHDVSFMVRPRR